MEELKCPICKEPTSTYMGNARKDRLCRKHATMFKNGEIAKCEDCGEWYEVKNGCKCKIKLKNNNKNENHTCITCDKKTDGKPQCKECYNDVKNFIDTLNKNSTVHEFRDYYYNLKDRIFIMKGIDETKQYCKKLIAIAITNEKYNDDTSLTSRVYKDVETLISSKQQPTKNNFIIQEQKEKDEKNARIETSQDGHNLSSNMEVIIDDCLYNAFILHCYGKQIDEIEEKRKKCDWFIPILNGKGIYIEYWGMEKPDYLKDRKEKEELYKKYNIPYIGIEKDDPKKDTQSFKSNLLREIRNLAKEHYGFMPEWKK